MYLFTLQKVPYYHKLNNPLMIKSSILVNGFIPPVAQR